MNAKRQSRRSPVWLDAQQPLAEWYATGLGASIASQLESLLAERLGDVFGYQGLQVGNLANGRNLLAAAGLHRRLMLDAPGNTADIQADVNALPIAGGSMKAVLFFHTLDFCRYPHQALREADRILTDDGQLIIVGFNPFSAFGARHLLSGWRRREPWNGRFYSRGRVADWLSVLDYRVLDSRALFLRPPINSPRILDKLGGIEKLERWMSGVGGLYVLRARKQTVPMTPARRQRLLVRPGMTAAGLARAGRSGGSRAVSLPSNVARVDFRNR